MNTGAFIFAVTATLLCSSVLELLGAQAETDGGATSASNVMAVQAPANDNFSNSISVSGPAVVVTGSNVSATRQAGEPLITGSSGGASVWWSWVPTTSGPATIDTSGSSFDTLLGVYTGDAVNQLSLVAEDDDGAGLQSAVAFDAIAGAAYHVAVDGFGPARGAIRLNIRGAGGLVLESPTNGMLAVVGDTIPVTVRILPDFPNAVPSRVDFYQGGVLFHSLTNPPFTAVPTNVPPGSNTFYAIAYDSVGTPVQSGVATVFVQKIGVTILMPVANTLFATTNPIPIHAWGYAPDGIMTNIVFFVDGLRIGSDDTFPFSAVWSNVVGGSHRITAVGRSDRGAAYAAEGVSVGVARGFVSFDSVWRYLDNGSNQGTNWIGIDFDDSLWASGMAPLGYGDSAGRFPATTNSFGPNPGNKYVTTYLRQGFVVTNVGSFDRLALSIERDDGAVVYINGAEAGRFNMPSGTITHNTLAPAPAFDDGNFRFNLNVSPSLLVEGTNTLAVEVHQDSQSSSDLWFQSSIVGVPRIVHNLSPLVSITRPTNYQHFLSPASIMLQADALDPDGAVTRVEYLANGSTIGNSTNASEYTVFWNPSAVGAYTLTAVAFDNQGATITSSEVPIVVYDPFGTPLAAITSPDQRAVIEGPTNLLISAIAKALAGVTNVQFLANGVEIGNDDVEPYSTLWAAPFGTNALSAVTFDGAGARGTSSVVTIIITIPPSNSIPPKIFAQLPVGGSTITNLTNIMVMFTENIQNLDAFDLCVNGLPASSVDANHGRSNYVFGFPHPPYGLVNITWAASHGITDYGWPVVLPFDETVEGASWSYNLVDQTPPTISIRTPAPGSTVTNLVEIDVIFSETVTGVDAADLLVNSGPAMNVTGAGASYTFRVSQPPSGTVNVTWAATNNIVDVAVTPNAFNRSAPGSAWGFTLDARTVLVQSNSLWHFSKGTNEASMPPDSWRQLVFDDSGWSNLLAPFFFGDPYGNELNPGTFLSDMLSSYTTLFLRQEFTVLNRGSITNVLINAQSDDGYIAWINGVEVRRYNVPFGELPYDATASAGAPEPRNNGAGYIVATLNNAAVAALVDGKNVLAVQAFNQNLTNSSDFGFNAQLYTFPLDTSTVAPRLLTPAPVPGDVLYLTNITVTFSESVSGVDAADLLVNGVPASQLYSQTNTTYTFGFAPPPYGEVLMTWDLGHGIIDFDGPPKRFDSTNATATFVYMLINPSNPRVLTQVPVASVTVTGLTEITVIFTESVSGVDGSDLLINAAPAVFVSTGDSTTYKFSFVQPPFGSVVVAWVTNHGISDIEAGNAFDPVRFGAQWSYSLIDPVPSVMITTPTNNTYSLEPATVTISALATDNDGAVTRVAFYEGDSLLGDDNTPPHSLTLSNLLLGTYTFRAVAQDEGGLTRTSAPVVLNVVTSLPAVLVRGPYLQVGTPTGGIVRWRTDVPTDAVVFYGTDPGYLTNFALEASVTNEHIVRVSGLQPSTRYYYSIGSGAQRLAGTNNNNSEYWFDTSPSVGARKHTRIWALGDAGTAGNGPADRQQRTRDAFYAYAATTGEPDIWLMLGDNAYNVGSDAEHQRAVFDMYPSTLRNKFLWPTLGNHETSQSTTATDFPYLHIFSLPRNGEAGGLASGTEKYYSFDQANIHFVCLDSMTSGQAATTPMADWLRNDLAATTAEWIIVFFHHPPYTKGSHDSDREQDLINIRQNLVPIMESNGVDLVLSGHSHCWERSYLIHGHYGLSSSMNDSLKVDAGDGRPDGGGPYRKNSESQGVVYTVAGSSGQTTGGSLDHPAHFRSLNELGSMVIDVFENRLHAIFLDSTTNILDSFTLLKPDPRPRTPVNLVALPVGTAEAAVGWTDVATNEVGYLLERSIDGITFSEKLAVGADAVSAADTDVVANVTYYYRLRATNSFGFSEYSTIASVTILPSVTLLQGTAAGLVVTADNGTEPALEFYRSQMLLRWEDRSDNEAAFLIERSLDGSLFLPIGTVGANQSVYRDRGLDSAVVYFYRVRAINAGGQSAASEIGSEQTHPQSQFAFFGQNVTFQAGTEGSPDMRYQWRFRGGAILDETNQTLVLTNVDVPSTGEYTVLLRGTNGATISNPAQLIVVSPPRIIAEPQDTIRGRGMSTQIGVSIYGTEPFTYTWHKNGMAFSGNTPTLSFESVELNDAGDYAVIISNNFGSITSRVAKLAVFTLPSLVQVPDMFGEVLKPLLVSNIAVDLNDPPLDLRYTLASGPTNSSVNSRKGHFHWIPNRSQAPSSNIITISVFDRTNPILSNSMTFSVLVNDYVEVGLGSLVLVGGTNGIAPIHLFSSLAATGVQCTVSFPGDRFTEVSLEELAPTIAAVEFRRLDLNSASLSIRPPAEGDFVGFYDLARLRFTSAPQTLSAALPLPVTALSASPRRLGSAPTLVASGGQIVLIGTRPLLDAHLNAQGQRELTVYAQPGIYQLQWSTNLNDPSWRLRGNLSMAATNPVRLFNAGNTPPTNVPGFFRLRR